MIDASEFALAYSRRISHGRDLHVCNTTHHGRSFRHIGLEDQSTMAAYSIAYAELFRLLSLPQCKETITPVSVEGQEVIERISSRTLPRDQRIPVPFATREL